MGIQVDSDTELNELNQRFTKAALPVEEQKAAACCYAQSNKYWTVDPQGIAWEAFHSLATIPIFGEDTPVPVKSASACCEPQKPIDLRVFNVLILCTGNSARSIMTEAVFNKIGEGRFKAYSAGSHPAGAVHPLAIEQIQALNYPIEGLRSKSWDEFATPDAPIMDFVITVCDKAAGEVCPVWPGRPITAYWGFEDPAAVQGTEEEQRRAFQNVLSYIMARVRFFLVLPLASLDSLAIKQEMDKIGQIKNT